MAADGSYIPANVSRERWIDVEIEVEPSVQSYLDSLDKELSNQSGFKKPPTRILRKCRTTSQTDPDSGHINHGSKHVIGYLMEVTVDCKHGILTGTDVYIYILPIKKESTWSCSIGNGKSILTFQCPSLLWIADMRRGLFTEGWSY